jgi:cell wall-associated NlpC family hydrolase
VAITPWLGVPERGAYIGIPYVDRGRDPVLDRGLDCWGLIRWVYALEDRGALPLYGIGEYASAEDRGAVAGVVSRHLSEYHEATEPDPFDIVLFRVGGELCHVGVLVDPGHFLHIRRSTDSVVERLSSPLWRDRVAGFVRPR